MPNVAICKTTRRAGLAALLLCVVALACASHPAPAPTAPPLALSVSNRGYYDANVYVLANDVIIRKLGVVGGFSVERYTLTGWAYVPGQSIALYARTIAEGREYRSGSVAIMPGYGLQWTLDGRGYEWLVPVSLADSH